MQSILSSLLGLRSRHEILTCSQARFAVGRNIGTKRATGGDAATKSDSYDFPNQISGMLGACACIRQVTAAVACHDLQAHKSWERRLELPRQQAQALQPLLLCWVQGVQG